jgi:hypothetical protein
MVYDPSNVATGFLSGIGEAQAQKGREMNMEIAQTEMNTRAAKAKKEQRIGGLLQQYMGGDTKAAGMLAGQGVSGLQALAVGDKYLSGQQKAKADKMKSAQEAAAKDFASAIPFSLNVQDEQEWKTQAFPYLADKFVQAGGDPALVRQINDLPMAEAQGIIREMTGEAKATKATTKTYQSKSDPDKTYTLNMNNPEDVKFIEENKADLIPAATRQIQGKPEDFSTDKTADDMAKIEAATRTFIADIREAQDFVKSNPAALTDVSSLARIGTNIAANIDVLRQDFDVDVEDESILEVETYTDTLKELGIDNAEMRSIMVGLAAQQAIINNPSGRISDKDIKLAMDQIGSSIQTAEGFIRITDRIANRADRVFRAQYKSRSKGKKDFEGDVGLGEVETSEFTVGQQKRQGDNVFEWDGTQWKYVE